MKKSFPKIRLEELDIPARYLQGLIKNKLTPVILLSGDMGAGKTTFTSIFVNLFGKVDFVNSPTFNLYNVYRTPTVDIYHFDLYRLRDPVELENLEVEEIWGKQGISIIEWWQIARDYLPDDCIEVRITMTEPDFRDIVISEYHRNEADK